MLFVKVVTLFFKASVMCSKCGTCCQNERNLEEHTKVCTGTKERPFKCKHCDKTYKAKKELWSYKKAKHKVFNFVLYIGLLWECMLIYMLRSKELNMYEHYIHNFSHRSRKHILKKAR